MKFIAIGKGDAHLAIIEAPTWFDAKHFVMARHGEETYVNGPIAEADPRPVMVELKWVGTDSGSPKRHLEFRERAKPEDPWSEWARQ